MKTIIIYLLFLFIFFSCKKDDIKTEEEKLTQTIQKKIIQGLKDGLVLKSIRLVKTDTLTEIQEADALLRYSTYNATRLNKKQEQLINELGYIKSKEDLELNKLKYKKLSDSIKYYLKIGESVENLKLKNIKTGNYQTIFLTTVLDKKTNKVKNDSLFLYVDEKKVIYTQLEFVKQAIIKFQKTKSNKSK